MPTHATADNDEQTIRSVIERYAAAVVGGDRAAAVGCYHDDFTLHWFGHALAGAHVGKEASLAALRAFAERTGRKVQAAVATMAGSERGAIVFRERLGRGDTATELERVLVFTVRDGLLHECWVYDDDQALVARLVG